MKSSPLARLEHDVYPVGMSSSSVPTSLRAGFWSSWVTPEFVAGQSVRLSELRAAGGWLYWLEGRPQAAGRTILVGVDLGGGSSRRVDISPPDRDVGSRVHEYGGGSYAVAPDGRIVLSDRKEAGVWLRDMDGAWRGLGGRSGCRYADFAFDPGGNGLFAVCEDAGVEGVEPKASLVWFGPDGIERPIMSGADFYAAPRPAPDGAFLAWYEWNHPDMPWDATTLKVASILRDGLVPVLASCQRMSGGDERCSVIEPVWQSARVLLANSDAVGGWRPYRFDLADEGGAGSVAFSLPDPRAEVGLPPWVFGQETLRPLPDGSLLALGTRNGLPVVLRLNGEEWQEMSLGAPASCPVSTGDRFAWLDAAPDHAPRVVSGRPGEDPVVLGEAFAWPEAVSPQDVAAPRALTFPTVDGSQAHALFYAPASAHQILQAGEKPPLVVMAHGGPTTAASPAFSFKVQWWTSRGFAVIDVNYRGSTGFGRAYRQALDGEWGVLDVSDCLDAVRYVLDEGLADPARCVIRGSSAGGLTVLGCLARSSLFAAGTSLYGVTDLRSLAEETHKFESRYLDRLIGPYPEDEAVYLERSPVSHADGIQAPVLFLHGSEDRVVPLSQAELMVERLRARGKWAELHVYPGEAHGFRRQDTLMDSFERELRFYRDVFTGRE